MLKPGQTDAELASKRHGFCCLFLFPFGCALFSFVSVVCFRLFAIYVCLFRLLFVCRSFTFLFVFFFFVCVLFVCLPFGSLLFGCFFAFVI